MGPIPFGSCFIIYASPIIDNEPKFLQRTPERGAVELSMIQNKFELFFFKKTSNFCKQLHKPVNIT